MRSLALALALTLTIAAGALPALAAPPAHTAGHHAAPAADDTRAAPGAPKDKAKTTKHADPAANAKKRGPDPAATAAGTTSAEGADRAAGTGPIAAGQRFKTVTRTFVSPQPILIPPEGTAGPYPTTILVGGLRHGHLKDVDLRLQSLDHTFPDDLDLLLVAPNGRNAVIMSDVGGAVAFGGGLPLTLDDEATSSLPDTGPLTSGSFRPTNIGATDTFPDPAPALSGETALSVFDGGNPNGTWQLYILDDKADDSGLIIGGWSLRITARVRR